MKTELEVSKKELEKAYLETGSFDKAAAKLNMNRKTFSKYYNKLILHKTNKPIKTIAQCNDDALIDQLQERGYFISKEAQMQDYHFTPNILPFKGDTYKIGVISDTHIGSRWQQMTHLHSFYKYCAEQNVRDIFHSGDILDGQSVYKGHEFELFLHGADAQIDYCANNYPEYDDITTYFICGNHDESHYKKAGIDVGKHLVNRRKDMQYKGFYGAYFNLGGVDKLIYLHHGKGGVAYARSYKSQKLIEQFSPDQKPFMLFDGHYHVGNHLPMYRNVYAWQMPCFQSQTPFLKSLGLYPEIFGLIIEITIVNGKPIKFNQEIVPFHVPITEDFK